MPKLMMHDFYCLCCGKKQYTIPRPRGHMREKFHRKKMYCPTCRVEVNMIEIRNDWEAWDFKEDFEAGVYKEEADASLSYTTGVKCYG